MGGGGSVGHGGMRWIQTSPPRESLVRQTLYGNGFWEKEFGKTSTDVFLPDCFGFSGALPTVAAHCGLNGFSTQKLTWGSAYGIPFNIGKWCGPDGSVLFAALDPGGYGAHLEKDLSQDKGLLQRAKKLEATSGIAADYRYFGTGDTGGRRPRGACNGWKRASRGAGRSR